MGTGSQVGSKCRSTCESKRKAHGQDMERKQGSGGLTHRECDDGIRQDAENKRDNEGQRSAVRKRAANHTHGSDQARSPSTSSRRTSSSKMCLVVERDAGTTAPSYDEESPGPISFYCTVTIETYWP